MARISKIDHPRILHLVEVEKRKIVEVAAEYGCTPANIYALLGKMRRARVEEDVADRKAIDSTRVVTPPGDQLQGFAEVATATSKAAGPSDLFAEAAVEITAPPIRDFDPVAEVRTTATVAQTPVLSSLNASTMAPCLDGNDQLHMTLLDAPADRPGSSLTLVKDLPKKVPSAGLTGLGGLLARTGFGLTMRTADGDENITPFRSLDDLLSAIKPILRSAARSPDAVWFSIHPVDLATLDLDAA